MITTLHIFLHLALKKVLNVVRGMHFGRRKSKLFSIMIVGKRKFWRQKSYILILVSCQLENSCWDLIICTYQQTLGVINKKCFHEGHYRQGLDIGHDQECTFNCYVFLLRAPYQPHCLIWCKNCRIDVPESWMFKYWNLISFAI